MRNLNEISNEILKTEKIIKKIEQIMVKNKISKDSEQGKSLLKMHEEACKAQVELINEMNA